MLTDRMVDDADSVKAQLFAAERDLALAMERELTSRQMYAGLKQSYQDAEAEIAFELQMNADGKNAEQRKAQVDIGLIRSRNDGALRSLWGRMVNAQYDAESAKVALEQMLRRYRAVEAAAELTTAMLHALGR